MPGLCPLEMPDGRNWIGCHCRRDPHVGSAEVELSSLRIQSARHVLFHEDLILFITSPGISHLLLDLVKAERALRV